MRQPGYYWVKWGNKWHIAYCDAINDWHIAGILSIFSSSDFEEIDERRIERTEVSGDEEMKKAINELYGTKYGSDIDKNPEWT